ncbi:MAG: hypothetical protein K2K60_02775 [Clostridia bacterium]|nr:hypothetical protein [Clostridia bacterium]
MDENKNKDSEKVEIRHTINAEETFTLAKDVFDLRCLIKNIYSNRAIIARRLNILSLTISFVYTLLYVGYIFLTGLTQKLNLGGEIALFCLLGVYAAMFAVLFILTLCGTGAKAKNIRRLNKAMSVFRLIVRLLSLALTIVALVFATADGYAAKHIAFDIVLIIISIICLVFQVIPLLAGGIGKLARWLLSPVKIKYRFSVVALEWYELAVTDGGENKTVKRVSKKYYDDIGVCLDNYLIPELGKKYVSQIKPAAILNVVEGAGEEEKLLVEGILKNIFEYATECGYVTFNPCRDLNFEGSIEEEVKQKKTLKERLMGVGKKVGMSLLDKYINKNSSND